MRRAGIVSKSNVPKHLRKQILLEELKGYGVTESQEGAPLETLSYDDIKHEIVLATFRRRDVEADGNRWF
ncbi:hypothetical protein H9655_08985 [Cytobacillus sp. Sa5YUA1]|uniref:Fur-regulated basic protein FbpA n=1 Tax=Cytobacillus stercorigallinarum TaxID=2762240 RepID=A0ABR8QNR2_9BACI|nr:hypothetical protein [Cytobacillus stercorigallinarum]MBD7937165.1 hypothetical protein [Cytobacillus stercorigallinarum]